MITMGTLLPHDIRLAGDPEIKNTDRVYAWVMNNFWETNFAIDLGGWHEFRYVITLEKPDGPEKQLQRCRAISTGTAVVEL